MSSDARLGETVELAPLAEVPTERYEVFRHPRRLRLLEILEDETRQPLSALTTALLEYEDADVSNGQHRRDVRCSLVHNHLPRLAASDIVTWDVETGAKLTDGHPICPSALTTLLEHDRQLDDIVGEVVEPVRLALLNLLAEYDPPVSTDALASALHTRVDALPADTDRAKIALHHNHLPALDSIDLLEYDRDAKQVVQQDTVVSF